MSSLASGNARQYGDSQKLPAFARLDSEYTIAETGWFPWVWSNCPSTVEIAFSMWVAARGGSGRQRRTSCRRNST